MSWPRDISDIIRQEIDKAVSRIEADCAKLEAAAYRRGVEDACRIVDAPGDMADHELTQYGKDRRAIAAYARRVLLPAPADKGEG